MHDPMVVVFDLHAPVPLREGASWGDEPRWGVQRRRYTSEQRLGEPLDPWWRPVAWTVWMAGRRLRLWRIVTVWHVEPEGRDSGTVCKGMGSSELTLNNVRWAAQHWRHLDVRVLPYMRVKRWLFDRCDHCGHRFLWRQARVGYMSSDKVWHQQCQALLHTRHQLQDAAKVMTHTADDTTRWRVDYWLDREKTPQDRR